MCETETDWMRTNKPLIRKQKTLGQAWVTSFYL